MSETDSSYMIRNCKQLIKTLNLSVYIALNRVIGLYEFVHSNIFLESDKYIIFLACLLKFISFQMNDKYFRRSIYLVGNLSQNVLFTLTAVQFVSFFNIIYISLHIKHNEINFYSYIIE